MCCIADAEQPRSVPLPQSIDLHGEELDRVPTLEFVNAIRCKRRQLRHALMERDQPLRFDVTAGTFGNHKPALPIVSAVQHDEDAAAVESAHWIDRIASLPRESEPEDRKSTRLDSSH